jgi:hypothetical protein
VSKFIGKRRTAGIVAILAACIAGASAYAFTASNVVPAHIAGGGSAVVSGYTITGPTDYTFSADGTTVTKVSFTLSAAATDVAASLTAGAPTTSDWTHCVITAGTGAACTLPVPVANGAALKLSVVATSSGTVTIS